MVVAERTGRRASFARCGRYRLRQGPHGRDPTEGREPRDNDGLGLDVTAGGLMRRAIFAGLLSSLFLLLTAQAASAQDTVKCEGLVIGFVPGNVEIPRDTHCEIFAAQIEGNVSALSGSSFRMLQTEVDGNVSGVEIKDTIIGNGNTVGGNIQLHNALGQLDVTETEVPNGRIDIAHFQGTSLLFRENDFVSATIRRSVIGTLMSVESNTFDQELKVVENTGPGTKRVQNNTGRVLHCARNAAPFVGGPNSAAKYEPPPPEGQCF